VYHAAVDHFNLTLPPSTTVNLVDGNEYVSSLARMRREGTFEGQKWRYVIQDCFSGGSVPEEMFTKEFWTDLVENLEQDGIVTMVSSGSPVARESQRLTDSHCRTSSAC
jgi:spermidine synthase